MHLFCLLAARLAARADAERGDVPGWVLITGMTVALVMVRLSTYGTRWPGRARLPGVRGVLRPWGFAVPRVLRGRAGGVRLRPRRSICTDRRSEERRVGKECRSR